MQTNEQLLLAIENYLAQTEFPAEPERLYAPIGYSLAGGGKRLRPMLLMLAHGIFTDRFQAALPAAAAVEVFHNFTLLHDDIMDNAAVRRGKPSVYAKWGPSVAILSGDAMMICAYRLLSEVPAELLPRILGTFNTMALEVCEGLQYDMDFESKRKVSVVEYMHMIELKTSVLLAGSVTIGAMLGGASEEDCRKLRRFAIEAGTYTPELADGLKERLATVFNRGFWEGYYAGRIAGGGHSGRSRFGLLRRRQAQQALGVSRQLHARRSGEDRRHGTRRRREDLSDGQYHRL